MKSFVIFFGIILMVFWGNMTAQEPLDQEYSPIRSIFPTPDSLLNIVLKNNKSLVAARELNLVSQLDARTGNTPPDPEVEMGYLFGQPDALGNRIDFSVNQEFDFPTTYVHRSRLRDIKYSRAELEYLVTQQNILLEAKWLWIERIYLNQQDQLIRKRLENARKINQHFRLKVKAGEISKLSLSQSNLQTTALRSEQEQVQMKIMNNHLAINEISGGTGIDIGDTIFPATRQFIGDSILLAYETSPQMQLYRKNLEIKNQEKKLTVSKNWPKLSAGYYSESVLDTHFRGMKFGISVPLWENANKIKQAKSEMVFAEADIQSFESIQQKEILQLLAQYNSLWAQIIDLEAALSEVNDETLLNIALQAGEISFTEYLYASELYFRNLQTLLELKKKHLKTEAELLKIFL